jgi:hypothetical protein
MDYIAKQGAMGKQAGEQKYATRLLGQAYRDPSQRESALSELGITQPELAMDAQAKFAADDAAKQARRAELVSERAKRLSALPEDMWPSAWPTMRESLRELDPELYAALPEQADVATFRPLVQQYAGAAEGVPTVRSSFVGADGQMYSIMSDGSVKAQGVGADRKLQAFDVPGVGPQVVDLRAATARTVTPGGGQMPAQPASTFAFTPAPGTQGDPDADAFAALPPDQQAEAARLLQAKQDFTIQGGKVVPTGLSGGQPIAPPAVRPAWVRPDKPAGRTAPPSGYRYAPDGVTLEPIPGGPADKPAPGETAAESKARREAALKIPRVDAAVRRLDRVSSAVESLASGLVDGGPIDAYALKFSPKGQELTTAVASLLPELTALTRVPGIGSQSDLETRLANLQLPSLEVSPEINRRTLEELRTFMLDLQAAYKNLAGEAAQDAPADDDDALIGKYL